MRCIIKPVAQSGQYFRNYQLSKLLEQLSFCCVVNTIKPSLEVSPTTWVFGLAVIYIQFPIQIRLSATEYLQSAIPDPNRKNFHKKLLLQWWRQTASPCRIVFARWRQRAPHLIHDSYLSSSEFVPKWHLDRFIRSAGLMVATDKQTDRQTDRQTVAIGRACAVHAMPTKNSPHRQSTGDLLDLVLRT